MYGSSGEAVTDFNSLLKYTDITPAMVADTAANAWWMTAILQLNGIVKGYADFTMRPTSNLSMGELAKVTSLSTRFIQTYNENRIPWYADILDRYASVGIIFNGDAIARRGDAVKLIYDTLKIKEGASS